MRLIGENVLTEAVRRHADLRPWLAQWRERVLASHWRSLTELRRDYPSADGVRATDRTLTVFNVRGNDYRLITVVNYAVQTVQAMAILTHAEYSKDQWKRL